jgi:hypothetical protein
LDGLLEEHAVGVLETALPTTAPEMTLSSMVTAAAVADTQVRTYRQRSVNPKIRTFKHKVKVKLSL